MSKRLGRKPNSEIRDNLVELLYFLKEAYGYDLYKKFIKVYDKKISIRSVYYHLNKGVDMGLFNIKEVQEVTGEYSWGSGVKRVIFSLGSAAQPKGSQAVFNKLTNIQNNK